MSLPDPTVSLVVPVHDEAPNLPALYARVVEVMEREGVGFELLLVDDGSQDDSLQAMQALRAADPRVSVLSLSRNFGHQVAITAGMEHACGQAVVVMDADLQDPPEVVPQLLAQWRAGYDVVHAVRVRRHGETRFKRATAALYYRLLRSMASVELPLDAGDFRLLSRRALEELRRLPERHRYVRGLVSWVGFHSTSVSYERASRQAGVTKYSAVKMVRLAVDGLVAFSTVPLRLASWLGLALLGVSLAGGLWLLVRALAGGEGPTGTSAVLLGVGLVGGCQLLALGVLGEYVGRSHEEARGRPLYVVERWDGVGPALGEAGAVALAPRAVPPGRAPSPVEPLTRRSAQ